MSDIRWDLVLKPEIEYLSNLYRDIDIKKEFVPVIEMLNRNIIKSRIIVNGNKLIAYAYAIESKTLLDTIYADAGFIDKNDINDIRLDYIFNWIDAISGNRKVLMNRIYNSSDGLEDYLIGHGYKKAVRYRLVSSINNSNSVCSNEFLTLGNIDYDQFSDAEYRAYIDGPDGFLFSKIPSCRHNATREMFNGKYGEIINKASFLMVGSEIDAAVIASRKDDKSAFIDTIFVKKDLRSKGLGRKLMECSMMALKSLNYNKVYLYVNSENTAALNLYRSLGFIKDDYPDDIIYYKIKY
ncbi:GNAT family N-acetyltransferase [Picrophilus oshimae]|uniref:N-acetyltransferase domain-containing protein n=1 Tax=Picrophilus torridus (strain ATCC 700027 / DSM 9790 / JCM 10055 / NBRC 100828 / KAW 2/3) TaxID=1122961 RepID=Q6L0H2_PICTO|nr:GNAT family N-acetyltransferase [Picrophilus oshimae]AAT43530.1 hypothetical protein PTO0945 [Picrophilus oshimae DSM 9789]